MVRVQKLIKRPLEQENLPKIQFKSNKSEKRVHFFLESGKSSIQYLVAKLTQILVCTYNSK